MSPRLRSRLAGAAALAAVVAGTLVVQALEDDGPRATPPPAVTADRVQEQPAADGLPTITPADLPPEGRRTLVLLDDGGPFPYERDGVVFGNREGLLPAQARGCYHEYTVRTPGESDRGARRIVTSCTGPRYWTDDHYESFARITGARL